MMFIPSLPTTREELALVVTVAHGGYELSAYDGLPSDLATAEPLKGFDATPFHVNDWLAENIPALTDLAPLLPGRPRVRFVYDAGDPYLNVLPLEQIFARRYNIPLVRHPSECQRVSLT